MLSPLSFSLLCALFLSLPLALLFTSTTTTITTPPPPPPLPENDESLFPLAARVNPNPHPHPSSPKRIAFMFLTTTPLPFAPLWHRFFNQTPQAHNLYNVYVHADPNTLYDPPFSGPFSGRVIPSKPTQRLTPSLISAARRLLAHALLHDPANSMFALLSSTCVPLHSFNFTYSTLVRSSKSFIEILRDEPGAYDRWVARGNDSMLPEVPFEKFRVGSQFWVLTRRHARVVVGDERLWARFGMPCVRLDVCYPEEHYFPTLMSMRDPRGCVPATLTHVDWRGRSDGHPRTYGAEEVGPELVMRLRTERPRYGDDGGVNGSDYLGGGQREELNFLFARKFSPDALQPLMDIANEKPVGEGQAKWQPPYAGRHTCNIDAAVLPEKGYSTYGSVIYDEYGEFVVAMGGRFQGAYDPKGAEAMSLREALSWIKRLNLEGANIEMDALAVIQAMRNRKEG